MLVKNDLYDYEHRYIYQDSEFFKFSVDSILLAEFANRDYENKKILDLCAGNMAIPLILSKYTDSQIIGFEIQNNVYKLGKQSIDLNNLNQQLMIINDDVENLGKYFVSEYFDIMVCNPPYFKVNDNKVVNNSKELSIARHELMLTLDDIFKLARTYLKNKGSIFLVHRVERLDEIINLGYKYQINVKEIQFISTKKGEKPRILLVRAVKNSKSGLKVNSEICIEDVKSYQNIFKEKS